MKILHLSDLHFGKNLNSISLTESGDQAYLVRKILEIADEKKPDAVLITGDVYDRGIPPKEATTLLSHFLEELIVNRKLPTMMIAGNHDGGERLEFLSNLLADSNLYIAGTAGKELTKAVIDCDGEPVTFWLMPYVFPGKVRDLFGLSNEEVPDYESAVRTLLANQQVDFTKRNVLLAHQFVVDGEHEPLPSDSETSVGGVGAMDYTVFDGFDYVALGHLHRAQHIGRTSVRYAGTPMCYHFSEIGQNKGVLLVTLGPKGTEPEYEYVDIAPLHKMRRISGKFSELLESEKTNAGTNEYLSVTVTDSTPVYAVDDQLRAFYAGRGSKLLDISFRPERKERDTVLPGKDVENKSLVELFSEFYSDRNGEIMSAAEQDLINVIADRIIDGSTENEEELIDFIVDLACRQEDNV